MSDSASESSRERSATPTGPEWTYNPPDERPIPPIGDEETLRELKYLFDWCPPTFRVDPREQDRIVRSSRVSATTTYAREPSFYDKHLSPNHVLRKVIRLPNLVDDLVENTDSLLEALHRRNIVLPSVRAGGFATDNDRVMAYSNTAMRNEAQIAEYYSKYTEVYCLPVASTILLHPTTSAWLTIFSWSTVTCAQVHPIADGSLQFRRLDPGANPRARAYLEESWNHIDPSIAQDLQRASSYFPDLAIWEMKSLTVGTEDVMMGVSRLAFYCGMDSDSESRQFRWMFCDSQPAVCLTEHEKSDSVVCTDALEHPWNLPAGSEEPSQLNSQVIPPYDSESADDFVDDQLKSHGFSLAEFRKYSANEQAKLNAMQKKQAFLKRKARTEDGDYIDHHDRVELTAERLLQQAWSQAVHADSTVMILHSGNFEFVCIRHRETQTLFISDLISVGTMKQPGYGKLQVSIYIAIIQDVLARMRLLPPGGEYETQIEGIRGLNQAKNKRSEGGSKRTKGADGKPAGSKGEGSSGSGRPRRGARGGVKDEKGESESTDSSWPLEQALARQVMLLHLQYGIYHTVHPAVFFRGARNPDTRDLPTPPPSPVKEFSPDERLLLILDSEISGGATGRAHGGHFEIETAGETFKHKLDVVVKLAFEPDQQDRLIHESVVYQYLRDEELKGIPIYMGVFSDAMDQDGPSALVMNNVGSSVRHRNKTLTSREKAAFLRVLKSMHDAGVLHGDLRIDNIMINDAGEVAIIDFDQSQLKADDKDLGYEYQQFDKLLNSFRPAPPVPRYDLMGKVIVEDVEAEDKDPDDAAAVAEGKKDVRKKKVEVEEGGKGKPEGGDAGSGGEGSAKVKGKSRTAGRPLRKASTKSKLKATSSTSALPSDEPKRGDSLRRSSRIRKIIEAEGGTSK